MEQPSKNSHTIRLQGYNYSQEGMYYITICAKEKACIFGEIQNGQTILSHRGKIIKETFLNISKQFPQISLDEYVIMPNHLHTIIQIDQSTNTPLGQIIGAFKSKSIHNYLQYIKKHNLNESCILWQRNYYEHVIRNDQDLNRIREYIQTNPLKWDEDTENPKNIDIPTRATARDRPYKK